MDYNNLNAKARSLIQSYGTTLILKVASQTTFDATLGQYTSNATSSYTVYGVIRSSGRMWGGDRYWGGDIIIESGDREIIIATQTTISPSAGDVIEIAGVDYKILACSPVEPGGTTLLYKTLCRR